MKIRGRFDTRPLERQPGRKISETCDQAHTCSESQRDITGNRVRIGLGAPTLWRMPWRDENCGATAFQGSSSTTAPAMLASDSFGLSGCFCRVRRWRVSGSARLSVFSVPAQGATGEGVAGAAGRRATRASAVCVRLTRSGSAGTAWSERHAHVRTMADLGVLAVHSTGLEP
jgi:hypothetical protein